MNDTLPVSAGPTPEPEPAPVPSNEVIKATFDRVYGTFATYAKQIETHRDLRRSHTDIETLRQRKQLEAHETYIAVRVIDENIERDKPVALAYLKQSPRYAVFVPADGSIDQRIPSLEAYFTTLMRYSDPSWEEDYLATIDGSLAHGIDYVEVLYDATKPGHVAVNHVGIDRLIHDLNYDDIQQSPMVARGYRFGPLEIEYYQRAGLFKSDVAAKLLDILKQSGGATTLTSTSEPTIYKIYFKHEGLMHFTWYARSIHDFLTDPQPFYNGVSAEQTDYVMSPGAIEPTPVKQFIRKQEAVYPFVGLRKKLTEDKQLANISGHARDSYYLQEAAATLTSALVNGAMEASHTMWAPADSAGLESAAPGQNPSFTIKRNAIFTRPMQSFAPPYPDAGMISTLQYLETRNGIATNQPAFAVTNRKDARKTATEMQLAQQQTSQINSVQVLHLSIFVREVAKRAWNIIRSEVAQGNITLPPHLDGELFRREYIISSAGDIDYVQREQLVAAFQQDWPILSATPIGPLLLEDYIRARYQAYGVADRYIAALKSAAAEGPALVQAMAAVIQELSTDETGALNGEAQPHAQNLQLLAQRVGKYLQTNGGAVGNVAAPSANSAASGQPA